MDSRPWIYSHRQCGKFLLNKPYRRTRWGWVLDSKYTD